MVWWLPALMLELVHLTMDSDGDLSAIHWILDPIVLPIPDVKGLKKDKCQLTRTPYGRCFVNEVISYFAFLFKLIITKAPLVGLNVSLSRYGLFHGPLFFATKSGRFGILFHAKEYPVFEKDSFPYNLGYC